MARNESAVVIVGAGASGLSAAGALQRKGIEPLVLERDPRIGGTWERRYDRLHLHTVRSFSGLAHYAIPGSYPRYLSRDQYAAYLREYVRALGLRVETGAAVQAIRRDTRTHPPWAVVTDRGSWHAAAVVVATGQYCTPRMPDWPGLDTYRGKLLHSTRYANAASFVHQRVLVVGAGNSGTEIATDLAEQGADVTLSVRTAPPIVPRDPFGLPVQRTSILLGLLPAGVADRFARLTARLVLGDLGQYGFPPAAWLPYAARRVPVIDVGFVDMLRRGRIRVRPAVTALTETGAQFADGTADTFGVVIAATGFATGLRELVDPTGVLDADDEPLAPSGESTAQPGLFFTGYVHSLRGHLFEANRTSRRLARRVAAYLRRGSTE